MKNINFIWRHFADYDLGIFDLNNPECKADFTTLAPLLPPTRQHRRQTKFSATDQKLTIASYFMLRQMLGINDYPDFQYNENGKPAIPGQKPFSISATANVVCVVVAPHQVGVDIEAIQPYHAAMANFICNAAEITHLEQATNRDYVFTQIYTTKESILKCEGQNLSYDFRKLDSTHYTIVHQEYLHHIITICQKIKF